MADYSSRTLLTPSSRFMKPYGAGNATRTTYKLPCLILSLLSILGACVAGAVVILLTSHKDPVHVWKISPAICLSILTGVYAIALGALFSTGVAVMWWRCIAHGTTLERLHFVQAGTSPTNLIPAYLAGSHARRVAVVALLVFATKLVVGPMLQRSTSPEPYEAKRSIEMSIELAPEIPDDFFGAQETFVGNGISTGQATFFGWNITTENTTSHLCPSRGVCQAHVEAAGMNLWNTTESTVLNLLDPANVNKTLFSINLTLNEDFDSPILFLETQFVSSIDNDCIATVTHEIYGMIPAIMRYPVVIEGNRIMPDISNVADNPVIISNYSSSDVNGTANVLKGILDALRPIHNSEGVLYISKEGKPATYAPVVGQDLNGLWADMFAISSVSPGSEYPENAAKYCPLLWDSPTKYVLGNILDYTFRAARAAATQRNDQGDRQNFTAVYTGEELWHVTDFRWLVGSAAVMIFGVIAACSLLWGCWQLGRYVTLSPLETGKALGAPILSQAGPEREVKFIVRNIGAELVAYDDEELIWAGSLYATGVGGSLKGGTSPRPSRSSDEPGLGDVPHLESYEDNHTKSRRHRRGVRSINEADPIRISRTFEHDRGYTTRKPYGDEEEMDIGQYGRPWGNDQANDHVPLIQMLSHIAAPRTDSPYEGIPQGPPVPSPTNFQMRTLNERKKPRRASVRGSLPSIKEADMPTPDSSGR